MKTLLIERYLDAGLIQFGMFEVGEVVRPFAIKLDMLPSYPELLLRSAMALVRAAGEDPFSHLLTPARSIALGTAVGLEMTTPLVYQPRHDKTELVGAFDIGHPAAMIIDVFDRKFPPMTLINYARHVGLDIQYAYALVDLENGALPPGIQVFSVLTLRRIVDWAAGDRRIPPGQANAVRDWIRLQ